MKRIRRVGPATTASLMLATLVALVPQIVDAPPAGATFPGTNGRLVFSSWNGSVTRLRTMNPDGSDIEVVTPSTYSAFDPVWSPDGTTIAFVHNGSSIRTIAPDGSDETRIVRLYYDIPVSFSVITDLAWSPDGTQIAFGALLNRKFQDKIFVVDLTAGTPPTRISGSHDNDVDPSWSNDGTRIAVTSYATGPGTIVTMDPDGSNRTTVVASGDSSHPEWSPDDSALVFAHRAGPRFDVFTVPAAGGSLTRITFTRARWELGPVWSPDGTLIAFSRSKNRSNATLHNLWTIPAIGGSATRITDTTRLDEFSVDWQAA